MRAICCRAWGGAESLALEEVAAPVPGSGQVLVAVEAAGVNFADTLIIQGKYQEKPPLPFTPGLEVAGRIGALGEGVSRFAVGQRVLALLDHGGFAEQAVARESDVFAIPDDMSFEVAAGFPITYGTAYAGLLWRAGLQPGETALVHGAAGGTGLAAVEVAKAAGARVIATAGGPERLEIARRHGADLLIDYRGEDLRQRVRELTEGAGVGLVFDPVGGEIFDASLRCLAWSGRVVVVGFAGGRVPQIPANLLLVKNIAALGLYWGSYRRHAPERLREAFEQLFSWFSEGRLKPLVSQSFALSRAGEALGLLQRRQASGKLVITPGDAS